MVNLGCQKFLLCLMTGVLTFFTAGLLFILCFEHVDNLGAYPQPFFISRCVPNRHIEHIPSVNANYSACHSLCLTYIRNGYSIAGMAKKSAVQAPLTPAVLHILLALSTGERHGYGIMKQVQADSQGKAKMGPGTLYGSMGRMMEAGLIRESDKRVDAEMDDERRIYYELTSAGRAALEAELNRYRSVVAVAKGRLAHGH